MGLLVLVAWLCALEGTPAAHAQEAEINTRCPVMTEEEVDPKITLTYRGKTVAFCCDKCLKKFQNAPERYLPNLPQFAGLLGGFASAEESKAPEGQSEDPSRPNGNFARIERETPFWGRIHPAIVHFPVAGLPLAFLGFLAGSVTGKGAFARADVVPLLFATVAAVAAVITGNIAEDAERFSPAMQIIVERHQFISTTVMVLALVLAALRLWRWNKMQGGWRWAYGGGLFAGCVLVCATGYLGGSLVFGPDHLKW